jgi:transposase
MSTNGQRKKWTPEEKLRIVLTGMQPGIEVADLCRREGLNPALFYYWKKQLLGAASEVFGSKEKSGRSSRQEEQKAAEVRKLKDVIAEITAENLDLKKRNRSLV